MTTVLEALNGGLHQAMSSDSRVIFLGEDILDPYGGAFKVGRGLSTSFPGRVLTSPVSEAAIVGIASGLALRGLRPVVEIMFGDFVSLACDQLLNHACKYRGIYNDQVRVPMVVRTPMGGGRGYGPTHSQSIEKHFIGMPGLQVVAPNSLSDPQQLLLHCILMSEDPTLFIEHKLLYAARIREASDSAEFEWHLTSSAFPTATLRVKGATESSVTILTYGHSAELVLAAIWRLAVEHEIFVEAVVPTLIHPMDTAPLLSSLRRTRRLVTVEEGGVSSGWGSEAISIAAEQVHGQFVARRVASCDSCIPCSKPLEAAVLPSVQDICDAVLQIVEAKTLKATV